MFARATFLACVVQYFLTIFATPNNLLYVTLCEIYSVCVVTVRICDENRAFLRVIYTARRYCIQRVLREKPCATRVSSNLYKITSLKTERARKPRRHDPQKVDFSQRDYVFSCYFVYNIYIYIYGNTLEQRSHAGFRATGILYNMRVFRPRNLYSLYTIQIHQ